MSEFKIGDLIRRERIKNGFTTQKDFADVTGVSPATLSRIEKNTQKPTPETLMLISKHLPDVTYGELMKAAGYLEGLNEEHEQFITEFLNENEKLDNRIFELIDSIFSFTKVDTYLHTDLLKLFASTQIIDLYANCSADDIKNLYCQNDPDIETKRNLIESLESLLKKYSPKLGEYLQFHKTPHPIPLVGSICAGDGIIANEDIEEYITFPFTGTNQPDYALRVKGDSMINAGIQDGDIVFLKKESWPTFNGQIVAVIVNGEEGTLKRMKWSEGNPKFLLSPENEAYQSMEVTPNEIIVCGTYAGHFRPYV